MQGFLAPALDPASALALYLAQVFPNLEPSEYNLEEVLSHLDLSRSRSAAWGYDSMEVAQQVAQHYAAVLAIVNARLTVPLDSPCPIHLELFGRLEKRDTILSFNYDLIADVVLTKLETPDGKDRPESHSRIAKLPQVIGNPMFFGGSPPSLMPQEEERGFYLKLHGSLDWLHCSTTNCPNNQRVFATLSEILGEGQASGRPCRICGAALTQMIVPPVATKKNDDRGRLAFVWNLAVRELMLAECVVLIGLSFAPSDFDLRWLLRAGKLARANRKCAALIVNPEQSHRENAKAALPEPVEKVQEFPSLDEFLKSPWAAPPGQAA
jgi:hypothetical protein